MTSEILKKLAREIRRGISTEVQVVYLLVGIRKIIERDALDLPALRFHCDWALHPAMDRNKQAQAILRHFDALHAHGREFRVPPGDLQREVLRIATMEAFRAEFEQFSQMYGLPRLRTRLRTRTAGSGWLSFMRRYLSVVSDIPLTVHGFGADAPKHISYVTMTVSFPDELSGKKVHYVSRWAAHSRSGEGVTDFLIGPTVEQ
jgi:hypothetical protein